MNYARMNELSEPMQEREWSMMREDRDQFQREAERLEIVNKECERYAGKLERATEAIRVVCKLAIGAHTDAAEVFDAIMQLATVKDDRSMIR